MESPESERSRVPKTALLGAGSIGVIGVNVELAAVAELGVSENSDGVVIEDVSPDLRRSSFGLRVYSLLNEGFFDVSGPARTGSEVVRNGIFAALSSLWTSGWTILGASSCCSLDFSSLLRERLRNSRDTLPGPAETFLSSSEASAGTSDEAVGVQLTNRNSFGFPSLLTFGLMFVLRNPCLFVFAEESFITRF
ncbi:hypothetical protein OGAPHI_003712 [Ogataea philodendri]|uniref:Uncharacterized protein n=1 Tax=Ogataea philodendri TaxID=1378263 RepID=A0A9P8T542_9ASCO|nr:uncharacterized protein OGAPHI_003712 [Ogataea philodendri]KAH3665526.1 hypothetical protein OGAPHI_003712 [Ogataea philodendri]